MNYRHLLSGESVSEFSRAAEQTVVGHVNWRGYRRYCMLARLCLHLDT